ncbi:adenylate/guanylate cyclase domain-containing protein [Shimia sp.]|uniref:adenylate/guanylate cyclase domain-containing protein n=1 Tax=Shimia sp. TaxID=1954381 RepID=UPI003298FB64
MKRNIQAFLFIAIVGGVIGALYGLLIDTLLDRGNGIAAMPRGAVRGIIVASAVAGLEMWVSAGVIGQWLRKMAFGPALALRVAITTLILLTVLSTTHIVFIRDLQNYLVWVQRGLPNDFMLAAAMAFLVQVMLATRRLIGARTLTNFLLGRYSRPTHENRIFVLADMVGSTSIAEQLGDAAALDMISSVFLDIDPAIRRHGGEVHSYVGDEVVISWAQRDRRANARVVRCLSDITRILETRRPYYMQRFGHAPTLRIGVAAGPVAVGECGWEKRQVVYIGDTINRAKRLQEACKQHSVCLLTDETSAMHLPVSGPTSWRAVGETTLRGRANPSCLVTLETSAGEHARVISEKSFHLPLQILNKAPRLQQLESN